MRVLAVRGRHVKLRANPLHQTLLDQRAGRRQARVVRLQAIGFKRQLAVKVGAIGQVKAHVARGGQHLQRGMRLDGRQLRFFAQRGQVQIGLPGHQPGQRVGMALRGDRQRSQHRAFA